MAVADPWQQAKDVIGSTRVTLGPQASQQYLNAPEHLAMVLARYRAAAALIGDAGTVLEIGCGEGIGAAVLAKGRERYCGVDNDGEAVQIAAATHALRNNAGFVELDVMRGLDPLWFPGNTFDAVVSLDVIEHIPSALEERLLKAAAGQLRDHSVCVIGTPNAAFEHLASPQSRAGHINTYTHGRLHALMSKHFRVVQSFGMQDTSLHLGHPDARHYLLMAGIGPVR